MNKLAENKIQIIVAGVFAGLLIVVYVVYVYVIQPKQIQKETLQDSIQTLESQAKDTVGLNNRLSGVKEDVREMEIEVERLKTEMDYKPVTYIDFLETVGNEKDKSGVEIVSVTEGEIITLDTHWEMPYDIVLAGGYKDILTFVNGFYQLDMFHIVTDVKMKKQSSNLTSKREIILGEDWAKSITTNIEGIYQGMWTVPEEDGENEGNDKKEDIETNEDDILYLELKLNFVTIEDPTIKR